MTDPRHIGVVCELDDFIEVFRVRVAELNIAHSLLDRLAGLQPGYTGKLLGPAGIRGLGKDSFGRLREALALKIIVIEDVDAARDLEGRWEAKRRQDHDDAKRSARLGKRTVERMLPVVLAEIGKLGAAARMVKMRPATRRRVARQAAKARWAKARGSSGAA